MSDDNTPPETEATEAPAKKAPPEPTAEQKAKQALRGRIKTLRKEREEGRGSWDGKKMNASRRQLHRLRRQLRKVAKAAK